MLEKAITDFRKNVNAPSQVQYGLGKGLFAYDKI